MLENPSCEAETAMTSIEPSSDRWFAQANPEAIGGKLSVVTLYLEASFWAMKAPMTLPIKLPPTIRNMKGHQPLGLIPISLQAT